MVSLPIELVNRIVMTSRPIMNADLKEDIEGLLEWREGAYKYKMAHYGFLLEYDRCCNPNRLYDQRARLYLRLFQRQMNYAIDSFMEGKGGMTTTDVIDLAHEAESYICGVYGED